MNQLELQSNFPTLAEAIRPTTFIENKALNERLGATVTIASETFQHTGSFKFRAAYNFALKIPEKKILTASSGNFGQALALACQLLSKTCFVVMPSTSAPVKINGVKAFGGTVILTDVNVKSRAKCLQELAFDHPDAILASPFDNQHVIDGNATLGKEICDPDKNFDYIVVPIGGGGLASGMLSAVNAAKLTTKVIAAEPLMANDAARSFREGRIVQNEKEPQTLADGARTLSLGTLNWAMLRQGLESIIEVPEDDIVEAMRLLYSPVNLKSEPTGALPIAAMLTNPDKFKGKKVCCVISGGNVEPLVYSKIIAASY